MQKLYFFSHFLLSKRIVSSETIRGIKAAYGSWVQQFTPFDSWTLTVGILLSKVFFSVTKGPDYDFKLCIFSKEKHTA